MKKFALPITIVVILVVGYLVFTAGSNSLTTRKPSDQDGTVQPPPPPNGAPIDTSNWEVNGQEFINKKYRVSVNMPSVFQYTNESGEVLFLGSKEISNYFDYNYYIKNTNEGAGFIDICDQYGCGDYGRHAPGPKIDESTITIDGVAAVKRIYEGRFESVNYPLIRVEIYEFNREGKYYHIEFTSVKENFGLWNDFYEVIQSFKFL